MGINAKPFNHASWIKREIEILSVLGRCVGVLRRTSLVRSRFKSEQSSLSRFIRGDIIGLSIDEGDEALKVEKGYYLTPGDALFSSYIASQAFIDTQAQKQPHPQAKARLLSKHMAVLEAKHHTIPPQEWQKIYKLVAQIKARDNPTNVFKISTLDPDNHFGRSFIVFGDVVYALDRKQSVGKGAFGRVRLAYNEKGEKLAIKIMLDSKNNKHYCFQRYAGIDFQKALHFINFTQTEKIDIAFNLAKELETLHSLNIIHGDICARNIVMDREGTIRLVDFGQARILPEANACVETLSVKQNEETLRVFNTRIAAPETVRQNKLSKRSDIYAFGLFLKHQLNLDNANELLNKMLDVDAAKRPSIEEIIGWLRTIRLNNDLQRLTLGSDQPFLQAYQPQPRSITSAEETTCASEKREMRGNCCLL